MAQSILKQASERAAEAAQNASRVVSAAADALEDGVTSARRAARQGSEAVTEFIDDTTKQVKRYPMETALLTFAAGVAAGALIGWNMKPKQG